MPIEIIDLVEFAHKEKRRKEIFNTHTHLTSYSKRETSNKIV